jgi:hypothetical protein
MNERLDPARRTDRRMWQKLLRNQAIAVWPNAQLHETHSQFKNLISLNSHDVGLWFYGSAKNSHV